MNEAAIALALGRSIARWNTLLSGALHDSNLQHLLEVRQVARTGPGDKGNVLKAHPADLRVVKARLHRDDLAGLQIASRVWPHTRGLVDLQAQPVAGAVEKALHATFAPAGPVAFLDEVVLNSLVHFRRRDPGAHLTEREGLPLQDGGIEFPNRFAGPAANNGARNVAKIARLLRAGENVQDDGFVGAQRAIASLMGVAALLAASGLINRHGYRGASVELISAELNVTKGSFYHHMTDKEELLLACFEHRFALNREAIRKSEAMGDGWLRVHAVATSLVAYHASAEHGRLLRSQALAALVGDERDAMLRRYRDMAYRLAVVISAGIADGSVRPVDPFIAAALVLSTVNASLDLHHWMRDVQSVDLLEEFVRPALTGLPI